jgi:Ser/Thr protein kinase RdoA (MazF antagonist)
MRNNLDTASLILQLYSLILLIQDYNNSDLMQELQKQDNEYFEKIIENQNEILTLLRKEDNDAREIRKEN